MKREVTLGYSVPKAFLQKNIKFLGSLRLSASGRNLWFFAPNMLTGLNFDPEVLSNFPDSNVQGFDLGSAPTTKVKALPNFPARPVRPIRCT